jgi:anaerobic selenocysteine-containing dehydrogenase
LDWILEPSGITFEQFREEGILSGKKTYWHYESDGFDTSTGRVELFSEKLKEWNVDPLPVYHELPETPFSATDLSRKFPLIAVNRKSAYYKHSRDRQIPSLRRMHPEPIVKVHIHTAGRVGIEEGDMVYIETKRGRIRQKAKLIKNIDPRVVEIDYGWYFPEKKERDLLGWDISNMNILTDNKPPFNREMGSTNLRGFCCRVYKCNEGEGSSSPNSSLDADS